MYILYGFKNSGSAAIEIALERCATPYQIISTASWETNAALAELEKINPLKQIPTLHLPDGSVLTESAAILIHLGLEFPKSNILPANPVKRSQVIRGLVYIAANCYSAISIIDYPGRWCVEAEEPVQGLVRQGARNQLHRNWEIFADQFPAQPFLSGISPGGLDYLAVVVSKWSGARAHLQTTRPEFFATLEKLERHPWIAPVFARHWN